MLRSIIRLAQPVFINVVIGWSGMAFADDGYDLTFRDGALIVTAITRSHQESDFQSYKRLLKTHPERHIQYSSDVTSGFWTLTISENAVNGAKRYWPYFLDKTTYKSSTALSVSRDIWTKVTGTGTADFSLYISENEELFCDGQLRKRSVGHHKVIYDDRVRHIPVVHAELEGIASEKESGAKLGNCSANLTFLDHEANPVILHLEAHAAGHHEPSSLSVDVVRIDSGGSIKERIRNLLSEGQRAAVYGIHFDFGEATIRHDSYPVLGAIAELLNEHPALSLNLEGHTDWIGDDVWNQKLSEQRAHSVVEALVQSFDIDAKRLNAVGFGEARPVPGSDQNTLLGRAINRRVEVVPMQ